MLCSSGDLPQGVVCSAPGLVQCTAWAAIQGGLGGGCYGLRWPRVPLAPLLGCLVLGALSKSRGLWALVSSQLTSHEGAQPLVCEHTDASNQGQLLLLVSKGKQPVEVGVVVAGSHSWSHCHPSWEGSAPPSRGKQASRCQRLGFRTFCRAALLRPKRPTGLIPRPAYQAGSMSGAGKERAWAVPADATRVWPCAPAGGRAWCTRSASPGPPFTAADLPRPC